MCIADVRIEVEEIEAVLTNEVIKREVLEGDKAAEAARKIARAASKPLRTVSNDSETSKTEQTPEG